MILVRSGKPSFVESKAKGDANDDLRDYELRRAHHELAIYSTRRPSQLDKPRSYSNPSNCVIQVTM